MAASGQKLICLDGMNLDVAPQYLKATQARFIKNLYYQLSDLGEAGTANGANTGVLKPLPSNEIYCPFDLPLGDSHVIGTLPSRETSELYVFVFNSLSNHFIFRINGLTQTADLTKPNPCYNFQLSPEYFIGEGQCHLEVIYISDPDTGKQAVKKDLFWTDGFNYQGYLRFDDYLQTNGFDATLYPYFSGNYNKCALVRMGVPTPDDCITINEVPFNPLTDAGKNNNENYTTWQFRILITDVFGRLSEHGMISDLFYLSNNSCLEASDNLSRCINLTLFAGNPLTDKISIEYRNCNAEQWYLDSVLELYEGSNLGKWWLRPRNKDIVYDAVSNKITYTFCKDKLCDPVDKNETNRTAPGLPRVSQSITKIGKDIALSNNKDGFMPFGKDILDKVSIEVLKPVEQVGNPTANIAIWVRIYAPLESNYQKIWKRDNKYYYGGIAGDKGAINIFDYNQSFDIDGQKGFIGYLAGTNNYAVGVQYSLDSNNKLVKDEDFSQINTSQYFIKFEFSSVPKNTYLFRVAAPMSNPSTSDVRLTSATVGGIYSFNNLQVGNQKSYSKELVVNVCNGDYDTLVSGEMMLIYDLTATFTFSLTGVVTSESTVLCGYVHESQNDITLALEKPVELLQLQVDSPGHTNQNSIITDHNGFYWVTSLSNKIRVHLIGYCNCVKTQLARSGAGSGFKVYQFDIILGKVNPEGYQTYCTDFDTYPCSRVLIKGSVKLTGSGIGVPNINVLLGRGGMGVTDGNGGFVIIAHDDVINNGRIDNLYVMSAGCSFDCVEIKSISFLPCSICAERDVDAGTYSISFISNKGLLSNGRYGASLNGYDWLGRHGFSQTDDKLYFNIPSLNETKTFSPSQVNVIIPPDITFPDWVDYITLGVTVELNYGGNYISWIVDRFLFVDNSGNENTAAPTQIKIYYSSLNEYNAKNNFNTTTGWQITPQSATSPRTSDIVQFIRNGDGTWFDNPISVLVKYDQVGQYFLINYTDALKDLKDNALIRLANPNDCTNKDSFFELCGKYKVINGKIQQNKIPLNAFDTYYQYRQIPVPVPQGTGTDVIIELRQFGFPFEHPSVTDFWGLKCWNLGRPNVRNPYETEILHLNQIALSGALSVNAQLNYLNYFDDKNKIDFNVNNTGGIVYVIIKTGMAFILCQFKNFVVGYGDNIARLNSANIVSVPSGDDTFGKPERATTGDYGCQLFDKNTIREKEGLTQWLDRNRVAILQNDFQETIDVARYNKHDSTIVSWLVPKIKFQSNYNSINANKRYFHAVINPLNFEWILSEFEIGKDIFINNEREINVSKQETICFDILAKVWKNFISPTYEYMGYIEGSISGQILFYFQKGKAYSNTAKTFNTFSGVKCDDVYRFIFNTDGFKKKKFQSMAVYCVQKIYFSDLIKTENNQVSRLLKEYWKKALYFFSAPFLCDTTIVIENNISDSDNLEGSWIDVRLIGNPANIGEYSELYGVIIFADGEELTGS